VQDVGEVAVEDDAQAAEGVAVTHSGGHGSGVGVEFLESTGGRAAA
jgi:hypothetical protein